MTLDKKVKHSEVSDGALTLEEELSLYLKPQDEEIRQPEQARHENDACTKVLAGLKSVRNPPPSDARLKMLAGVNVLAHAVNMTLAISSSIFESEDARKLSLSSIFYLGLTLGTAFVLLKQLTHCNNVKLATLAPQQCIALITLLLGSGIGIRSPPADLQARH